MNYFNEKDGAKAFLWALFLPQVLVLVLLLILTSYFKDLEVLQQQPVYIISMMLVSQVAFFIVYMLTAKKSGLSLKNEIKKGAKSLKPINVLLCIAISVIAIVGFVYFVELFDKLFALWGYTPSGGGLKGNSFGIFALNVLLGAVVPAICEELVFRGIIFKGLKTKGHWFAIIVSAIMFMLVHQSLGSIVYPIIMGIVFCLVVEKTGSIVYSMIVHFCNNFFVLLIEYLQNITGKSFFADINMWWEIVLVIIFAVLAFVAIYLIIKHLLKPSNNNFMQQQNINNDAGDVNSQEVLYEKTQKDDGESCKFINRVIKYLKDRKITVYSLAIGIAFWLIVVITSLV